MGFETPENRNEKALELGGELSDTVLKAGEDFSLLVDAIKMMGENTRESLRRAIEAAENN